MLTTRTLRSKSAKYPEASPLAEPRRDLRAPPTANAGARRKRGHNLAAAFKLGSWLALCALCSACAKGTAPESAPAPQPEPEAAPAAAPAPPPPAGGALQQSAPSDIVEEAEPAEEPRRRALDESEKGGAADELAEAEQELARADAQLQSLAQGPAASASAPAGASADKPTKRTAAKAKDCETTCKAFASLLRARDAICRIDGQDGQRCARANDIVERREPQRSTCGCTP